MNALLRSAASLRARLALRRCDSVGADPWVRGTVWIHGGGTVRLGDRVRLDARAAPIEIHAAPGAEIRIGNDVHLKGGVSIEAHSLVTVGDGARLGGFCKVVDNHFHPMDGDRHRRPPSMPVTLEHDVDLGWRVVVLPGAHLAAGTHVRAGMVVRQVARSPGGQEA